MLICFLTLLQPPLSWTVPKHGGIDMTPQGLFPVVGMSETAISLPSNLLFSPLCLSPKFGTIQHVHLPEPSRVKP